MRSFFTEFYCLPIRDLLVLLAVATWGFLRLRQRFGGRGLWKLLLAVALLCFTAGILYLTVSTREAESSDLVLLRLFHSYREVLAGGNPEILRSNFMNVVLFYPAGLMMASLLPEKWGWLRILPAAAVFLALSIGVEYVQYTFGLGRAEIDDVLHNTLGAVIGAGCALIELPAPRK